MKYLILISILVGFNMIPPISENSESHETEAFEGITKAERKKAIKMLTESRDKLFKLTRKMSDEQLNFRPAQDRWTIMDNVDHLINVEEIVWNIITKAIEDSGTIKESQVSDDELIQTLSTRVKSYKAPPMLQPEPGRYKSIGDALEAFTEKRKRTIEFVKTTQVDLRAHFSSNPVFGDMDIYQYTLFPSSHCQRHIEQIEEIISHQRFPKR